ncbi:MAG TPA: hypothetical protein VLK30_05570 [Candidatus Limnocylindrales bacterium]|nr:hypothetical protein [Candidatus Limnocylindrales bacterium]
MARLCLVGMVVAVGLLTAACGVAEQAQPGAVTPDMNVTGTVDRGTMPTCPAGEPCDPQMVAAMLVFSRPGSPDVQVPVRGDGSFAVHLEPGLYSITPAPPAFHGELQPSTVRVPATGAVTLSLHIVGSP